MQNSLKYEWYANAMNLEVKGSIGGTKYVTKEQFIKMMLHIVDVKGAAPSTIAAAYEDLQEYCMRTLGHMDTDQINRLPRGDEDDSNYLNGILTRGECVALTMHLMQWL